MLSEFQGFLLVEKGDDLDESEEDVGIPIEKLQFLDLYRVFPKIAPDLESHIIASGKLKRSLLVSDGIYILDGGTELSLWIGKESWAQLRIVSTELLRVFLTQCSLLIFIVGCCINKNETKLDFHKQIC